ncbi:hypothetical protein LSAT2_013614 [Lamellibrachia satsuma]|nr:hypothetical protein LSAT2_013614 [Lamellibrachia satsuma]
MSSFSSLKMPTNMIQPQQASTSLAMKKIGKDGIHRAETWIPCNIKKRVCCTYMATKDDGHTCACGYLQEEHIENDHKNSVDSATWNIDRNTKLVKTDAYGKIQFSGVGQRIGQYVRVDHKTDMDVMMKLLKKCWDMEAPNLLISVTGGAKNFMMRPRLKEMFRRGLINVAKSTGAWIITGGMHAGVMKQVGEAVHDHLVAHGSKARLVVIGIATWGCVKGKKSLVKDGVETWLRNTPDDDQIIRALTIPGYKFTHVPRRQHKNTTVRGGGIAILHKSNIKMASTTARGGGIAILHKSNIKMASKSSWKTNSFENMEVTLSASSTVKLAVIYRPPPSKRNKSTIGLFLSEFQDFLQHHMVKSQNTLILSDFNFHYEDQLNTDASRFRDILSNHSLCQHVSGPTHINGHTLDLIITKLTDNLVSKTTVSDFLTDHGAVHCDLHLPKPQPLRQSVQYRNYAVLDKEMLRVDIEASTLCLDPVTSAASLLEQYDTTLSALLGKHAPV